MAKTCNNCATAENTNVTVPYVVHESAMARSERHNKRLWIVILVLIGALIGTNLAWIIYENSFEDVITTEEYYDVEQDADGGGDNNSIINGGVINGEAENQVHEENNENP